MAILRTLEHELKHRMKLAKRRPVANARAQVTSFNASVHPENIPDHNDPYKVEWTDVGTNGETGPGFLIGQKALCLPSSALTRYRLLYPLRHGSFNTQDYDSLREVLGDLETIWTEAIKEELGIEKGDLKNCNAVLVIPDTYNKAFVTEIVTMLLRFMRFRGVFVQQVRIIYLPESSCATFGAGISVACVVDIGAQKTSIACVEDGMCLPDSRVYLNYGGDDITTFFTALLLRNRFPYGDIDLARAYDWRLAEELKEKFCTMNEVGEHMTWSIVRFWSCVPRCYFLKPHCEFGILRDTRRRSACRFTISTRVCRIRRPRNISSRCMMKLSWRPCLVPRRRHVNPPRHRRRPEYPGSCGVVRGEDQKVLLKHHSRRRGRVGERVREDAGRSYRHHRPRAVSRDRPRGRTSCTARDGPAPAGVEGCVGTEQARHSKRNVDRQKGMGRGRRQVSKGSGVVRLVGEEDSSGKLGMK
ncbi:hypothetical protein BC936DRAFT_144904 [Jimgerdemannia flammicorona]|uniref:Uncharacterized protein n=1 Tax=Jimgerdemannia flammicorona TaxID=994334 RepID=A0A433DM37_9FUNG|nr:hypothetical protein BC936DRAFT_144904 [Jimgerdemannia flammicorona]